MYLLLLFIERMEFNMESQLENETLTNCPQCPKECPTTDLKCGRGRNFFHTQQSQLKSCSSNNDETNNTYKHYHKSTDDVQEHNGKKHEPFHHHKCCKHNEFHGDKHSMHGHGHSCEKHEEMKAYKCCKHKHKKFDIHSENIDELSSLIGKCGHFLYHQPHKGRGQKRILKILVEQEEVTQKQLQEYLDIHSGSISEIISKLESRGFVTRERDESDKRKVILKITEAGKAQVENFSHEEEKTSLYHSLNEEEQKTLKDLLKKLLNSWYPSRHSDE